MKTIILILLSFNCFCQTKIHKYLLTEINEYRNHPIKKCKKEGLLKLDSSLNSLKSVKKLVFNYELGKKQIKAAYNPDTIKGDSINFYGLLYMGNSIKNSVKELILYNPEARNYLLGSYKKGTNIGISVAINQEYCKNKFHIIFFIL